MQYKYAVHIVSGSAYVRKQAGEVLMIYNDRHGWHFPGGQIEQGEDLLVGVQREVLEETGIQCELTTLISVCSNISQYEGMVAGIG